MGFFEQEAGQLIATSFCVFSPRLIDRLGANCQPWWLLANLLLCSAISRWPLILLMVLNGFCVVAKVVIGTFSWTSTKDYMMCQLTLGHSKRAEWVDDPNRLPIGQSLAKARSIISPVHSLFIRVFF